MTKNLKQLEGHLSPVERVELWEAGELDEKPCLSFSQINMFLRCPEQYHWRYQRGVIQPPAAAMVQGRQLHKANQTHYQGILEGKSGFTISQVKEVFAALWQEAVGQEEIDFEGQAPYFYLDQGVKLAEVYHRDCAPFVRPLHVERKFQISLGEEFPFDFQGYIDLEDEFEGGVIIADTKFASRKPSEGECQRSLQLTSYSLGRRVVTQQVESGVRLDTIVKTKNPYYHPVISQRSKSNIQHFLQLLRVISQQILDGVHFPAPNNFLCSAKKCGYWNDCMGHFQGEPERALRS